MKTIKTQSAILSISLFAAATLITSCASSDETPTDAPQELALDGEPTQETKNGTNGLNNGLGNGLGNGANAAVNSGAPANNLGNLPEGLNGATNTFDPYKQQNGAIVNASPIANPSTIALANNANKTKNSTSVASNSTSVASNTLPPPENGAPLIFAETPTTTEDAAVPPINAVPETIGAPSPVKPNPLTADELEYWKTAAQKLRNLTPEETPSEYIVQAGDTLWDIADQLVDDYQWWPKLWVINSGITNPHQIYPGQKLVFFSSTGSDAPALLVRDLGTATPIPTNAAFVTQARQTQNKGPIDGELLDASQLSPDNSVELSGETLPSTSYVLQIPGFLSGSTPDSLGKIVISGERRMLTAKGKIAYGEFDTGPQPGQRFLTVREAQRGRDPLGNTVLGPDLYLYTGIVGVVKINQSGMVSLVVEESKTGVMEDDLLIPFSNIFAIVDSTPSGNKANVKAEVLATESEYGTTSGAGQVVILDREDGSASAGDLIDIYMPAGGIVNFEGDNSDPIIAAHARVLETKGDSISAVILSGTREVSVGARTWPEF